MPHSQQVLLLLISATISQPSYLMLTTKNNLQKHMNSRIFSQTNLYKFKISLAKKNWEETFFFMLWCGCCIWFILEWILTCFWNVLSNNRETMLCLQGSLHPEIQKFSCCKLTFHFLMISTNKRTKSTGNISKKIWGLLKKNPCWKQPTKKNKKH